MQNRFLIIVAAILAAGAGAMVLLRNPSPGTPNLKNVTTDSHRHSVTRNTAAAIPSYQQATEIKDLKATLPPNRFQGKTRSAYEIAKQIPETLAQLPCYCYCDKGFGHKSLHTCFEDDHAAHCAVCVDEALLAYRLQREEKLTPAEVRERIIERYSGAE
jgi:hypothetical protein